MFFFYSVASTAPRPFMGPSPSRPAAGRRVGALLESPVRIPGIWSRAWRGGWPSARFPGAPTLPGVSGRDCPAGGPGDATRDPARSLRLFSAAAATVLGWRPPPGPTGRLLRGTGLLRLVAFLPLPDASCHSPDVGRHDVAAALQLSPRSAPAILPFRFLGLSSSLPVSGLCTASRFLTIPPNPLF